MSYRRDDRRPDERRPDERRPAGGRTTLFVAGFPPNMRAKDLAYEFERMGPLVRCDIPALRSYNAKPYAFIEYEDPRDAEAAHNEMHGIRFGSYQISIQFAKNAPSSSWRFDGGPRGAPPPPPRRRSPSPRRSSRRSVSPPRRDRDDGPERPRDDDSRDRERGRGDRSRDERDDDRRRDGDDERETERRRDERDERDGDRRRDERGDDQEPPATKDDAMTPPPAPANGNDSPKGSP